MAEQVDVVVVGMGVGGEEVAGRLAEAGLSVVGIESRLVGGECPYWGCVPSKMMIRAANLLAEARRVDGMAGRARVDPDWAPVARRIREEATDNWDDKVAVDRFTGKGGRFVRGTRRLVGPGSRCRRRRASSRRSRAVVIAHRHRARRPADRRPGRHAVSGPTGRRSRPRRCRRRWSCWAAARSGWSWPRCSPGSAYG